MAIRFLPAGTDAAKHPVDAERLKIKDTIALTQLESSQNTDNCNDNH
jgi:hypothetical protein